MRGHGGRVGALALALVLGGCGSSEPGAADSSDDGGAASGSVTESTTHRPSDDTGSVDGEGSSVGDGPSGASTSGEETGEPSPSGPRWDEVRQKSAHNAFQRDEAVFDMLVWHRVRSLEFDIHVGKTLEPTIDGEWYVYHEDIADDETSCVHLRDCLGELVVLAHAVPQHEVVTVWVDLKDAWQDAHGPAELDALVAEVLGERVFPPAELLSRCPGAASVQAAALDPACGWPSLAELRGRVIVVLTGGAGNLADYDGTTAFVAPAIADAAAMPDWPQTAIFNAPSESIAVAGDIAQAGAVVRVYGLDDEATWTAAVSAGVHHLATDKVNGDRDPWAVTHDGDGWPFACREAVVTCEPGGPEPAAIVGVDVDSGDAWATADDAWFLRVDREGERDGTWTAFVATENSWVEPFAKGCLAARASLAADAPYFAVCRPADDGRLRVQVRTSAGGSSSATEADIVEPDTIDAPGAAFVRLRITEGGTCVAGDGSRDGETWVEIDAQCFAEPLGEQGLLASSHDGGVVRFLFGDVVVDDRSQLAAAAFEGIALGGATAEVYDGVRP